MKQVNSSQRSDFLRVYESELSSLWKRFDSKYTQMRSEIVECESVLELEFEWRRKIFHGEFPKSCSPEKVSDELLNEISQLIQHKRYIERELKDAEAPSEGKVQIDIKLIGRCLRDQNEILSKRVAYLEETKSINQKIIKSLLAECEEYEKRHEPHVEGSVLEHLVASRKAQEKSIEVQFNCEVGRIHEKFQVKWKKLSRSKQKCNKIDWKVRLEMLPTIKNLSEKLFEAKEKLLKVERELSEEERRQDDQAKIDEKLEDEYYELETTQSQLVEDLKIEKLETLKARNQLKEATEQLENVKSEAQRKLAELNEDNLVKQRIKEMHRDDLQVEVLERCESTKKEISSRDCIILSLRREICRLVRKIREAEIKKAKLVDAIDHLMDKGPKKVIGIDYLGSNFVKIV